jgi:hypothetical protein
MRKLADGGSSPKKNKGQSVLSKGETESMADEQSQYNPIVLQSKIN